MRSVFRSVVVVVGIATSVVTEPSGISLRASHQSDSAAVASVRPSTGQVVGVAHPIVVTFRAPVVNRRAAERAVDVRSTPSMTGKFEWLDNDVVQWVPDRYWPAHTKAPKKIKECSQQLAYAGIALYISSSVALVESLALKARASVREFRSSYQKELSGLSSLRAKSRPQRLRYLVRWAIALSGLWKICFQAVEVDVKNISRVRIHPPPCP